MDESFSAETGDAFETPKIVRWHVDVFIDGVKDTTWEFTDPVDLENFEKEEVAKNPNSKVTFSKPRALEEDVITE